MVIYAYLYFIYIALYFCLCFTNNGVKQKAETLRILSDKAGVEKNRLKNFN